MKAKKYFLLPMTFILFQSDTLRLRRVNSEHNALLDALTDAPDAADKQADIIVREMEQHQLLMEDNPLSEELRRYDASYYLRKECFNYGTITSCMIGTMLDHHSSNIHHNIISFSCAYSCVCVVVSIILFIIFLTHEIDRYYTNSEGHIETNVN